MKNGEITTQEQGGNVSKPRKWIQENKLVVILIFCIIIAIIIGLLLIIPISSRFVEKERNFRLPTNLIPSYYTLEIKPYIIPGNYKFEGKVEITVTCVEGTDEVVLHASGLEINEDEVSVKNVNSKELLKVLRIKYDKENQFLILQLLEQMRQNGTYRIFISYQGTMGDKGVGFYVSSYEDSNNVTCYTASTQFESINAREAFPCFDEPAMKAKFDITIVRWKNMTSLSNMNRIKREPRGGDWEADIYRTTLKMSTYLVAFFIGDYVGKSSDKITVWSRPDEIGLTDFALENSVKILHFFEDLLQPYMPPKLDMVPVAKLSSIAMENWGLIIFRRTNLLYNETDNDILTKKSIATVIAHEIAHQWFGNLVTPKWWSDIWLSEGITTYMEQIASKALFPQWYQLDKTTTSMYDYTRIIENDCQVHSTVHKTINSKTPDSQIFDMFIYKKGAAIIRMAHQILGDQIFWKGLSMYLEKYAYGNTEEKDLWECLNKAQYSRKTKMNMTEIMTSWTHLGGVPIITVQRDYDRQRVTFFQESCNPENIEKFKNDMWFVPISYTTANTREWNAGELMFLTGRSATVKYMATEEEWILVNSQSIGYYIVNYDRTNWNLLAGQLLKNHKVFPPEQRFKIMADANLLETINNIPIDTLLDLSLFIPKETKLFILSFNNIQFIWRNMNLLEHSYYQEDWEEYLLYLLEPIYKMVYREDKVDEILSPVELPVFLLGILCNVNYTPCVDKAMDVYHDWRSSKENGTKYSYRFTHVLLCIAMKYGEKSDLEYVYNAYLNSDEEELLTMLACSRDATVIKKLLWVIFEKNKGKSLFPLYTLAHSTHWAEILIYFNEHFDEIANHDSVFEQLVRILQATYSPAKYEQILATCKKFLTRLSGSKAELLMTHLEEIEKKLPNLEKKKELVEMWLGRKPWLEKQTS